MKKNVLKIFALSLIVFLAFALSFSLTSKSPPPSSDPTPSIPCDVDIQNNLETAFLQINFEAVDRIPFRKSGYGVVTS